MGVGSCHSIFICHINVREDEVRQVWESIWMGKPVKVQSQPLLQSQPRVSIIKATVE